MSCCPVPFILYAHSFSFIIYFINSVYLLMLLLFVFVVFFSFLIIIIILLNCYSLFWALASLGHGFSYITIFYSFKWKITSNFNGTKKELSIKKNCENNKGRVIYLRFSSLSRPENIQNPNFGFCFLIKRKRKFWIC